MKTERDAVWSRSRSCLEFQKVGWNFLANCKYVVRAEPALRKQSNLAGSQWLVSACGNANKDIP